MIAENGFPKNSLGVNSKESRESDGFGDLETGRERKDARGGDGDGDGGGLEVSKSFEIKFSGEGTTKKLDGVGFQELTLSYMCDSSKVEKDLAMNSAAESRIGLGKWQYKGKEASVHEKSSAEEGSGRFAERDFLELRREREDLGFKREGGGGGGEAGIEREKTDKKAKLEATPLDLSLGLPDVSLSLSSFNATSQKCDLPAPAPRRSHSVQSFEPSRASSDDITTSVSYSYSLPFSHNPSCSLTRNSIENFELSVSNGRLFGGGNDHIWHCGEGTNGSVHSRFKPVGEVTFQQSGLQYGSVHGDKPNQAPGMGTRLEHDLVLRKKVESLDCSRHSYPSMQGQPIKDVFNSLYRSNMADGHSFFPLEMPARLLKDNQPADMRERRRPDRHKVVDDGEFQRNRHEAGSIHTSSRGMIVMPERLLQEIVSEPVPVIAQLFQDLPEESLEAARMYVINLVALPEKKEEFACLQRRLEWRSDLTPEALSKSHKIQLDFLVTIKTGLASYLSGKFHLPMEELIEVFTLMRCRNVNCKSLLPVDDCDCKICSTKRGFCSACTCQICLNFDCALNTCTWVGCDVCSHWCHADCGIKMQCIRPGRRLKGTSGTTEMQFHCLGCGHASELFGFVKEVFLCCAMNWSPEAFVKELECVRRIFQGSTDIKDKALHSKVEEMIVKLDTKVASCSDVCSNMLSFLTDDVSKFCLSNGSQRDIAQPCQRIDTSLSSVPSATQALTCDKTSEFRIDVPRSTYNIGRVPHNETRDEMDLQFMSRKDAFSSLESIVRIKEAEARMFQTRADDAEREAESLRKIVRAKIAELEDEYASKVAKLCLQETRERQQKKLEELKFLQNTHCDYINMKMRMEAEIAGLLQRLEATKQQWI